VIHKAKRLPKMKKTEIRWDLQEGHEYGDWTMWGWMWKGDTKMLYFLNTTVFSAFLKNHQLEIDIIQGTWLIQKYAEEVSK
jgi:hypothetical protein